MSGWTVLPLLLVALPLLLLSVPLTCRARGCLRTGERRLKCRFSWGRGLLVVALEIDGSITSSRVRLAGITLPLPRIKPGTSPKKNKSKNQPKRKKESGLDFSDMAAAVNRQLLTELLGYLKRLFSSLQPRLRLSGVYGADDPAVTGMLAGIITTLPAGRRHLDLDADFSGPVVDITGTLKVRIMPIIVLWITTRFLLAKPVRSYWWTRRKKIPKKPKEASHYV